MATAKCRGCPPNYKPPKQCKYGDFEDYDESFYPKTAYTNGTYDKIFVKRISTQPLQALLQPVSGPARGDDHRRLPTA